MKKIESQQEIILFLEKTVYDLKKKCSKFEQQHKSDKKLVSSLKSKKENLTETLNNQHKSVTDFMTQKISKLEDELKDLLEFKQNKESIEEELSFTKDIRRNRKSNRICTRNDKSWLWY